MGTYNPEVTPDLAPLHLSPGQTLLFDADDTLWENNIYFERAIAAFISYLDHRTHSPEEVREHLNCCERKTIAEHGYGLKSFHRSLVACFEELTATPLSSETHDRIVQFAYSIAEHEIELLPGVPQTLQGLAQRHRCILVTKGDPAEQRDKLSRSGLEPFFSAIEVLPEKTPAAYRALVEHHVCEAPCTWMIGNSPKSDINPALASGLHAVFIPHGSTWILEHETLNAPGPSQHLLELPSFINLTTHF
jgi:putative hydrolase of the HAD superfamily